MRTIIVLPHFRIVYQTFDVISPQSHYTDSEASKPNLENLSVEREATSTTLTTLICRGPGSNPVPPDLLAGTLPTALPMPMLYRDALVVRC